MSHCALPQADNDRDFCKENLGLKTFPSIVYYPKVGSPC